MKIYSLHKKRTRYVQVAGFVWAPQRFVVRTKVYMLIIIVKTKRPSTELGSFVMEKILIKTKKKNLIQNKIIII